MKDYIARGSIGEYIRIFAAVTTETVRRAQNIHSTSPVVSAAFGRTLTMSAIMGAMLKNESDLLTVTIKSDGPIKGIVTTADYRGRVKGYVHEPIVDIPPKYAGKLDVGTAVGNGYLTVAKDTGEKEPYSSTIELVSGEIAEDFTQYFAVSEQVPTSAALGVLVDRDCSIINSGGFLLQLMPGASAVNGLIDRLEHDIMNLPQVTAMLSQGKSPEDIIALIANGEPYTITDRISVSYHCNCSKERVSKALAAMEPAEIQRIFDEDGHINVHCHFCNSDYLFENISDL